MDLDKIKKELNEKYPNIEVLSLAEKGNGAVGMEMSVGARELAYLKNDDKVGPLIPRVPGFKATNRKEAASANVMRRQALDRGDLDLAKKGVFKSKPHELFERSIRYYYEEDIYGSVIRMLANFSSNGFENDIDDDNIKLFFDNWVMDIGLDKLVEEIFFDFFRVGMVRTYKMTGRYDPKINILANPKIRNVRKTRRDTAARKIKWSRSNIPIHYTILNPLMVEITGSLLFNQSLVTLKAEALSDLKILLEKGKDELTEHQKKLLNNLPKDMLKAAKDGVPYPLNPYLVGEVDYRKMPYERYPRPRGVNAFESIDYKRELRNADYSTLDGISNYILKITVGNDQYPTTNSAVLENVAELFNTPAKSFNIVWNHTLQIEKIVSPEIGEILGQDKYEQVNEDYTGALGVVRALIDGVGDINVGAADLAMKSVIAEINYARNQVKRWLYREYRDVCEAMGFDRHPTVRFNDIALRDEIEMMRVIQGLIDRRIMSYETGTKRLGLDWTTELKRLSTEKDKVLSGDLGIIGSPYNPKATPPMADTNQNVQETQRTPTGTPSEGRPAGGGGENASVKETSKDIVCRVKEDINKLTKRQKQKLLEQLKGE
jgi:hypothetical protein